MEKKQEEALKWLSIIHYVMAGLGVASLLFAFPFLIAGQHQMNARQAPTSVFERSFPPLPPLNGSIEKTAPAPVVRDPAPIEASSNSFTALEMFLWGGFFILVGIVAIQFFIGRFLTRRKHRVFCLVNAGVECLSFPIGTAIGVWTIVTLIDPKVKEAFEQKGDAATN